MASPTVMPQERIATPSMWTVQDPHCAMPHPYLVPVNPTFSRIAQRSGVSFSTSTLTVLPLILRFAIAFPLIGPIHRLGLREWWTGSWHSSNQEYGFAARKIIGGPVFPRALVPVPARLSATFQPPGRSTRLPLASGHINKEA